MTVAGTGHRPDKLDGDYESPRLLALATHILRVWRPEVVISGMALGWDQALARAAIALQIPFVAAVPFEGQEKRWPLVSQIRYFELLESAAEVAVVSEGGYSSEKMQIRNRWMVDRCDSLLALWNGTPGGTANCIAYAERQHVPIRNVWSDYIDTYTRT